MAMRALKIVLAMSLVPLGCRTAATADLWKNVPQADVDAGDPSYATDHATPDGGVPLPPSCAVDPASVTSTTTADVPAGVFAMGCQPANDAECRADENPGHDVTLADFAIDVNEITQAEYAVCLQDGKCTLPYCAWDPCTSPTLPIACVDYDQAQAYCAYVGKHLPTEAQWEKAARSSDGRKFPWGNDPADCTKANMDGCSGHTLPVGSLAAGASPFGALDMAGNVVEWVADVYDEAYYASSPATDPTGPARTATSQLSGRGGGWRSAEIWQRTSARDLYEWNYFKDSLGFRCAK